MTSWKKNYRFILCGVAVRLKTDTTVGNFSQGAFKHKKVISFDLTAMFSTGLLVSRENFFDFYFFHSNKSFYCDNVFVLTVCCDNKVTSASSFT